jgi:hypothetical protein
MISEIINSSEGIGSARNRRMAEAILAEALARGLVLRVSLFSVPILVRYNFLAFDVLNHGHDNVFSCVIFIAFGRVIILHWAGSVAVPPQHLIWTMSFWVLLSTLMNNEACLPQAANETASVGLRHDCRREPRLSIWLVQRIGAGGVILGMILFYVFVLVGPQTWKVRQILNARPGLVAKSQLALTTRTLNSR